MEATKVNIMNTEWIDGFKISVKVYNENEVTVSANKEGLLSLANHLKALADGAPGDHIHYDEFNSLEEGSIGMVIERER
jgi:hypothetical protein